MRAEAILVPLTLVVVCCLSFGAARHRPRHGPRQVAEYDPCEVVGCVSGTECRNTDGHARCYYPNGKVDCPFKCNSMEESSHICGSDGKTYPSLCGFEIGTCSWGKANVTAVSEEKCPPREDWQRYEPCEHVKCRRGTDCQNTNGQARCFDQNNKPECPRKQCELGWEPVCGSDGKTYEHACYFEIDACKSKSNVTIVNMRECDSQDEQPTPRPKNWARFGFREPDCDDD